MPTVGCPGQLLDTLTAHYDLVPPPFSTVGAYVLQTSWERVSSIGSTDLERFKGSIGIGSTDLERFEGDFTKTEYGRDQREVSPHLRTAPPEPGTWRIFSRFTIKGRVLGWPREQITPGFHSKNVYTAVPPGEKGCPTDG